MEWAALGKKVFGAGLPLLGTTLGGPAGAAVGATVAAALGVSGGPEEIAAAVKADPAAAAELRRIEAGLEADLARVALGQVQAVNETIRAEVAGEHWPSYSWRPWVGAWWPVTVVCVYVVLPLCRRPVPEIPETIWVGWAAILGVAAWYRGRTQLTRTGCEEPPGLLGRLGAALSGKEAR